MKRCKERDCHHCRTYRHSYCKIRKSSTKAAFELVRYIPNRSEDVIVEMEPTEYMAEQWAQWAKQHGTDFVVHEWTAK